ncbi:MAG TPA: hypothetical protein VE735_05250 [Gammaproteobacteria bacterium]|jgi:hypothetical protein|nr:hypothetical protein [Gammaproteobacteria bacterium]
MKDLIRLINIPVPPVLEQALGYDGKARYVAFYWELAGDELAWADDRVSIIGANWHAWLMYIQHPSVAHCLEPYELGNSDESARHWLLLDRQERILYVGTTPDVACFLAQHTPPVPAISREQLEATVDFLRLEAAAFKKVQPPDPSEIRKHKEEQARLLDELVAWLPRNII